MKKNNTLKRISKAVILIVALLFCKTTAYATPMTLPDGLTEADGETVSIFVYVTESTGGYEAADLNSSVVAELEKDKKLLMTQRIDDVWGKVMEQGRQMYVQLAYVEEVSENATLMEEMEELQAKRESEASQDVALRKKVVRGRIIGIVIAALIAGIFICGIVAALRSPDEEETEPKEEKKLDIEDLE